jgi:hypothetical protein
VKLAFALALALATIASSPALAQSPMMVMGSGNISCGTWVDHRRHSAVLSLADEAWVQGFITAYNAYVAPDGGVHASIDAGGVSGWVDNHCRAYPLDTLAMAAQYLVEELKRRPR